VSFENYEKREISYGTTDIVQSDVFGENFSVKVLEVEVFVVQITE